MKWKNNTNLIHAFSNKSTIKHARNFQNWMTSTWQALKSPFKMLTADYQNSRLKAAPGLRAAGRRYWGSNCSASLSRVRRVSNYWKTHSWRLKRRNLQREAQRSHDRQCVWNHPSIEPSHKPFASTTRMRTHRRKRIAICKARLSSKIVLTSANKRSNRIITTIKQFSSHQCREEMARRASYSSDRKRLLTM